MSKARTVGEKRAAKRSRRERTDEPHGRGWTAGEVVARETGGAGRPQRPTAALRVSMLARAHLAGIVLPTDGIGRPVLSAEMLHRLRQPWMGCAAGRAIESEAPEARAVYWGVISEVRRTYHRYWQVIGIPSPYPAAARMLYATDPAEDPPGSATTSEPRTIEDEVRAAVGAMMRCEQGLGAVRWVKACIIFDAPVQDRESLIRCLRGMV